MISDSDDYTAIVKLFLQAGADTEARDKVYHTFCAPNTNACRQINECFHANLPTLSLALSAFIVWQYGVTALLFAAHGGNSDVVRQLLDAGADKEAHDGVRCRYVLLRTLRWTLSIVKLFYYF